MPQRGEALGAPLLSQGRLDFTGSRDRMVHVARQGAGLLRGAREVVERRRHARGPEAQQVEPDVLHRQHTRLELIGHELPPGQQIREGLSLALEQADLSVPLRAVALALGGGDFFLEACERAPVHAPAHGVQGPR